MSGKRAGDFAIREKRVFLKFDDCFTPMSPEWDRSIDILERYGLRAGFGLITDICEVPPRPSPLIEYWFHGASHIDGKSNPSLPPRTREFLGTTGEMQAESLSRGLRRFSELTGKGREIIFAPPSNALEQMTIEMVDRNFPEIGLIIHCGNRVREGLTPVVDIEGCLVEFWEPRQRVNGRKVGTSCEVDWDAFLRRFIEKETVLIPMHPNYLNTPDGAWNEQSFRWLEILFAFLAENRITTLHLRELSGTGEALKS